MVGWAAATWDQCVRGLFRFYPDEVVAATVVAEARGLAQLWYLPHKEFVTAFYNKCLGDMVTEAGRVHRAHADAAVRQGAVAVPEPGAVHARHGAVRRIGTTSSP